MREQCYFPPLTTRILPLFPGKVTSKVINLVNNIHRWGRKSLFMCTGKDKVHMPYNPTEDGKPGKRNIYKNENNNNGSPLKKGNRNEDD